jgi:hypothetical protein
VPGKTAHFAPYDLSELIIEVELRGPTLRLSDPPLKAERIPIDYLVKEEFKDLPAPVIRSHHLSFEAFCKSVSNIFKVDFDENRDEFGWVFSSPYATMPQTFASANSELTWQNALGVMRNATSIADRPSALKIFLFSPAPKESAFRRSRRAPDQQSTRKPLPNEPPTSTPDALEPVDLDQPPTEGTLTWHMSDIPLCSVCFKTKH